jgi:hypothetical protein
MFRDPNSDGLNESQPFGSHPDFEDRDDDLPFEDLEPGVAEANLALIESGLDPDLSETDEK